MVETLLTPSNIKLYGRIVNSLQYIDDTATNATLLGSNNFLQHQLAVNQSIVTFTGATAVSGRTITVSAAALANLAPGMLVTGLTSAVAGSVGGNPAVTTPSVQVFAPGTYISTISTANTTFNVSANLPANALNQTGCSMTALSPAVSVARIYAFSFEGAIYSLPRPSLFLVHTAGSLIDIGSVGRSTTEMSGVVAREWEFAKSLGQGDLVYWEYEKGDFSIRFDTEAGPFDQILLAAALRAGADMADRSGASLSGASLGVRSGASLSGASLSGASLAGASLSGASLRGR
jgi:hypothetical protein